MSEDRTRANCRKGTVSCTECRRRKVRCIRSPEDAPTCRRCEERGSTCIAQLYSSRPRNAQRVSSRYRISQLESQVAGLSKIVHDIGLSIGHQPTQIPKPAHSPSSRVDDDSDDDSSVSDVIITADPPSHLRSLFQNDWLSVDTRQQNEQLQDRKAKASVHLLDAARHELQKLIPQKDEVIEVARSASKWLGLIVALLPQPFAIESGREMVELYDEMHKPDADAICLGSWLLTIAIAIQEMPNASHLSFSRAVSDRVESTILSHDGLICTLAGLGMALNFCRLQISHGNFQKGWLKLRHYISIAELMGLPRSSEAYQLNGSTGRDNDETQLQRAQMWESLCSAEGLFGMIVNLPCASQYQQSYSPPLAIDGVIQPRAYLIRLMNISTKIQYRDAELYASTLELDRQLNVLVSQVPKSWWAISSGKLQSEHVVQFLHYCVKMRIHLSFAMRRDTGDEYIYSRLACKDACEFSVERYQFLRQALPSNIFISQALDLQAFTATVVIILTSYSLRDRLSGRINSAVALVIHIMEERSRKSFGFDFALCGASTIRSLMKLLQDDKISGLQELTLRVPLLGKVHVRRNSHGSKKAEAQFTPQDQGLPLLTSIPPAQGEYQWDSLSWSIDDRYEDFFQAALNAGSFDQFAMWENGYNTF
ncbi:hypothetical protein VE01_10669 [Pseudogymnoascus verrucosus]|uniref:Zn(2)-C6 fungal-type domain-containing protein n=1 Tax=Pseudogymnoascus verrucosus TaxID=342668 RepID=A0A1B8G668_9PEZI|nr:uncharacterized protein VE01_10669 [Pseudogymnoascus verrucosus]OBT91329.1 hypothetical protein VE01_10669 [Pseudogymnoascus verrucosus]